MEQTATAYQSLQTEFAQLYSEYNALSELKRQLGTEYTQVRSIWQQLNFKYQYPQLEAELNALIANYANYNTPTALMPEVENYLAYLRTVDIGAEALQTKYQQYKQVPNRNGWEYTLEKLKTFLDKLPSLPLKHLKDMAQVHLPKAQQAIADMEAAMMNEQSIWSKLEREARSFKALLDSHNQTIDCHGFAAAYQHALNFVNRLIQAPSMAQLDQKELELSQHRSAINQCLQLFDEERQAIRDYEPHHGWRQIWREEAWDIQDMAKKAADDIYTSPIRLAQIVDAVSKGTKRKHQDIESALAHFKPETCEIFRPKIEELQEGDYPSGFLPDLVKKMKQYEAEQQKALLLKIAKWMAWILGGLLVLGGLYWLFSSYGIYIVVGLIVIGIAVKVFKS